MKAFADEKGKDVSDFKTQLEFLVSELSPTEDNYQLISYNGYAPADWESADNVEDSIEALVWTFYRPASEMGETLIDQQLEWAESFEKEVAQSQKDIHV